MSGDPSGNTVVFLRSDLRSYATISTLAILCRWDLLTLEKRIIDSHFPRPGAPSAARTYRKLPALRAKTGYGGD